MGWSAPELLAEVVSNAPKAFTDLPPIIISLHEEDEEGVFLRGVLWAIGLMAEAGVRNLEGAEELVLNSLNDGDARIRGLAAMAAGKLGTRKAAEILLNLRSDESDFNIYRNTELSQTTVGEQASVALEQLREYPD
jgi:HEAT repeat protein